MGIQSLHSHTLLSDGTQTHQQVLDAAQKYGIEVVAFTDHDALPDEKLLKELKNLNHQTKWLVGIEMSSGLPTEIGGGSSGPHVLGLFIDPFNKALLLHCQKTQQQRVDRMKQWVKKFKNLGFDITEQDVWDATTGLSIGQPHMVAALKSKEKNLKLMEEFVEKMRLAAENNSEINKKYQLMIQQGENQYPYVLFLKEDAFIKGVYVEDKYWLDLDQTARLIRNAGGLSFIAHYTTCKKFITSKILERLLRENRLDGMETVFGFWGYGNDEAPVIEADRKLVRDLLKKYQKFATGGADAHSEEDLKNFAGNIWYSEETIGMVENIIGNSNVSTEWSNLTV